MPIEFNGTGELPGHLIFFYGTECEHCHDMFPYIDRIEAEEKVTIVKLECWHNSKNDAIREKMDNGFCGGLPFIFNTKSKKGICGVVPYEKFKDWALGK